MHTYLRFEHNTFFVRMVKNGTLRYSYSVEFSGFRIAVRQWGTGVQGRREVVQNITTFLWCLAAGAMDMDKVSALICYENEHDFISI